MIIDIHYHYIRLSANEESAHRVMSDLLEDAQRTGFNKPTEGFIPVLRDMIDDPECDKLVKRMGENGIDMTAICYVDNYDNGSANERIMNSNELCARAAAKHPEKLISMAGIDPRRPDAPALLRRCLTEFKMKGLKWHPDDGYYPNSKEAYAMLGVLNEFGYPLLTHCSPLPKSRAKFALPIHLDDVAKDFPNLEIIAAHMGNLWWHDWLALAQYKKNISGDLAMWQITATAKPTLFRRYLREILDNIGPHQIIWSTDGPIFEPLVSNREFISIMKGLTVKDADGIVFTQAEVDAMLGGNAARIFKLKK
ncbi:MAG: amidohydrolase family protein [Dehalococcoidales bacterium]|nr:amidohydrolase family protein [Dehalococcoidales bacterium]